MYRITKCVVCERSITIDPFVNSETVCNRKICKERYRAVVADDAQRAARAMKEAMVSLSQDELTKEIKEWESLFRRER